MLTHTSPVRVPGAEQHWVDTVAELAAGFAETVGQDDAEARLPLDHLGALNSSGLDTAFLDPEHGGEALSYATFGSVVRAVAAAHPAVATVWIMHLGAAHSLTRHTTPETASYFAAELARGARFCNALSEPAGGNHFLQSQQDAEQTADGWALTGKKLFVSGSEAADHLYIGARVNGEQAFYGITVDDSISFPSFEETVGMRPTRSRSIVFEKTPLPADRQSGPPAPDYANFITVGLPMVSIGIAEAAMDALNDYARSKTSPVTGAALADAEWVRAEAGMTWAKVEAARLMAERALWLADTGSAEAISAATAAKMLANEVAKEAAALAVRVCGGSGYLLRSPVQRIFRDAQAGALMAYSVPFTQQVVGGWVLDPT